MRACLFIILSIALLYSCAKDPFTDLSIEDAWVYQTSKRDTIDYSSYTTFSRPNTIVVIRGSKAVKKEALTPYDTLLLYNFCDSLRARGYNEVARDSNPDLRIELCALKVVTANLEYDTLWDQYSSFYWPYSPDYFIDFNINTIEIISLHEVREKVPDLEVPEIPEVLEVPEEEVEIIEDLPIWSATISGDYIFDTQSADTTAIMFSRKAINASQYLRTYN